MFGSLVAAAIALRLDSESHMRLVLLATISLLGPAWVGFRHIFPSVDNPFLVFSLIADAVLLIAMARDLLAYTRDLLAYKRVHPVYLWAGGAMVVVHMIELAARKVLRGCTSQGGCLAGLRSDD